MLARVQGPKCAACGQRRRPTPRSGKRRHQLLAAALSGGTCHRCQRQHLAAEPFCAPQPKQWFRCLMSHTSLRRPSPSTSRTTSALCLGLPPLPLSAVGVPGHRELPSCQGGAPGRVLPQAQVGRLFALGALRSVQAHPRPHPVDNWGQVRRPFCTKASSTSSFSSRTGPQLLCNALALLPLVVTLHKCGGSQQ